jgi:hypothetical protein
MDVSNLFVALAAVTMVFGLPYAALRLPAYLRGRRLSKGRRELNRDEFLALFEKEGVTSRISGEVYDYLEKLSVVSRSPVLPDDDLRDVYSIETRFGEPITDVIADLTAECHCRQLGEVGEPKPEVPKTVADLVRLMKRLCEEG